MSHSSAARPAPLELAPLSLTEHYRDNMPNEINSPADDDSVSETSSTADDSDSQASFSTAASEDQPNPLDDISVENLIVDLAEFMIAREVEVPNLELLHTITARYRTVWSYPHQPWSLAGKILPHINSRVDTKIPKPFLVFVIQQHFLRWEVEHRAALTPNGLHADRIAPPHFKFPFPDSVRDPETFYTPRPAHWRYLVQGLWNSWALGSKHVEEYHVLERIVDAHFSTVVDYSRVEAGPGGQVRVYEAPPLLFPEYSLQFRKPKWDAQCATDDRQKGKKRRHSEAKGNAPGATDDLQEGKKPRHGEAKGNVPSATDDLLEGEKPSMVTPER